MNFKEIIKDCLPPVALRMVRSVKEKLQPPTEESSVAVEWEYLGDSAGGKWEIGEGWNTAAIAEKYREKWAKFVELSSGTQTLGINHEMPQVESPCFNSHNHHMILGYILGRLASNQRKISIFDLGGAVGHHLIVAKSLYPGLEISYACRELPSVVKAGRELLVGQTFYEDETWKNSTFDLVIASNSLQYFPDWKAKLKELVSVTRTCLWLTKIPTLKNENSFVILQRAYCFGYQTEYSSWCFNQDEFMGQAHRNGLGLVREFMVSAEDVKIFKVPEQPRQKGFLFEKR